MSSYEDYFKTRKNAAQKKPLKQTSTRDRRDKKDTRWLALIATILAAGSIWYLTVGEDETARLVNQVEISAFGKAVASEDEAKTADDKGKMEEKSASSATAEDQSHLGQVKPGPRVWTDEEIALFSKLDERKKQLDVREANLNKLEEELQKQRVEIEKKLSSLEEVRGKIAGRLEDKVKSDGEKVAALVTIYANMKPAQAAVIIQGMNEELAVEVLTKMKNKSAAEILNLMDAEKAKHLSERFAGFRDPASVPQN